MWTLIFFLLVIWIELWICSRCGVLMRTNSFLLDHIQTLHALGVGRWINTTKHFQITFSAGFSYLEYRYIRSWCILRHEFLVGVIWSFHTKKFWNIFFVEISHDTWQKCLVVHMCLCAKNFSGKIKFFLSRYRTLDIR